LRALGAARFARTFASRRRSLQKRFPIQNTNPPNTPSPRSDAAHCDAIGKRQATCRRSTIAHSFADTNRRLRGKAPKTTLPETKAGQPAARIQADKPLSPIDGKPPVVGQPSPSPTQTGGSGASAEINPSRNQSRTAAARSRRTTAAANRPQAARRRSAVACAFAHTAGASRAGARKTTSSRNQKPVSRYRDRADNRCRQ